MNRLILKYGTTVTVFILAVFTWVLHRRVADGGVKDTCITGNLGPRGLIASSSCIA